MLGIARRRTRRSQGIQRPTNFELDSSYELYQNLWWAALGKHAGSNYVHNSYDAANSGKLVNINPSEWDYSSEINRYGTISSVDQGHYQCGVTKGFNLGVTSELSFSCWCKTNISAFLGMASIYTSISDRIAIVTDTAGDVTVYRGPNIVVSGGKVNDNIIHHVGIRIRQFLAEIFVDGSLTAATGFNYQGVSDGELVFRAYNYNNVYYEWDGSLYDPMIWNKFLGDEELDILADPDPMMRGFIIDKSRKRNWVLMDVAPSLERPFILKARRECVSKQTQRGSNFDINPLNTLNEGNVFLGVLREIEGRDFKDSTIYENDGLLINSPSWHHSSEIKRPYLKFNGVDSYVNQFDKDFWTDKLVNGFSIAGWVRLSDISVTQSWLNKYQTGNEWTFGFLGGDCLGWVYDELNNKFIGRRVTGLSSYISNNEWNHFLLEWDGGVVSSGVKIYINGIQRDDTDFENPVGFVGIQNTDAPFYIGRQCSGFNEWFTGETSDIVIWNRALTNEERFIVSDKDDPCYSGWLKAKHQRKWLSAIGEVPIPPVTPTPWHLFSTSM